MNGIFSVLQYIRCIFRSLLTFSSEKQAETGQNTGQCRCKILTDTVFKENYLRVQSSKSSDGNVQCSNL